MTKPKCGAIRKPPGPSLPSWSPQARVAPERVNPLVFLVYLRQPDSRQDRRDDPFYEFGSFGCTGCHYILLHDHRRELEGARLAFAQGGHCGVRLVYLTPRITVVQRNLCEANWTPAEMPFRYDQAPILVRNDGHSDFDSVNRYVLENSTARDRDARELSREVRIASLFRSQTHPLQELQEGMAEEVISVYEQARATALDDASARTYDEALPDRPDWIDCTREAFRRTLSGDIREDHLMRLWQLSHRSLFGKERCDAQLLDCIVNAINQIPETEPRWEDFMRQIRWCIYQFRIRGSGERSQRCGEC
jgi:hypothetical protein